MSKYKSLIDRVTIPTPCDADWDSMVGNDQVRFCEHCDLTVHNISTMTRRRAEQLVADSKGRLCVRYHRSPEGEIVIAGSSVKLHKLTRRVSRLAASTLTVALSVSTAAFAQQSKDGSAQTTDSKKSKDPMKNNDTSKSNTIYGTIKDPQGAVVPGTTLILNAGDDVKPTEVTGNDAGDFVFANVEPGTYTLTANSPGFKRVVVKDFKNGWRRRRGRRLRFNWNDFGRGVMVMTGASISWSKRLGR